MNNKREIVLTVALVVLAAVIAWMALRPAPETQTIVMPDGTTKTVTLGGTNPDLISPYFRFGGVANYAGRMESLTLATTTVCAIQSPAATSTLQSGGLALSVSSTTASTVTVAKAATQYATTTLINSQAVAANAQAEVLFASTTVSALTQTNRIFGPNQYVVVGMQGGVGTFSPTGVCQATWQAF